MSGYSWSFTLFILSKEKKIERQIFRNYNVFTEIIL